MEVRSIKVEEEFQKGVSSSENFCQSFFEDMEDFSDQLRKGLEQTLAQLETSSGPVELKLTLELKEPDASELHAELDKLKKNTISRALSGAPSNRLGT